MNGISMGNGSKIGNTPASTQAPLAGSIEKLEFNVANLEQTIERLFSRLTPLRNTQVVLNEKPGTPPMPPKSPVVLQLDIITSRINHLTLVTESILTEIEI